MHLEVARILFDHGADPTSTGFYHRCWQFLIKKDNLEAFSLLIDSFCKHNIGKIKCCKALLTQFASFQIRMPRTTMADKGCSTR